MALTTSRLQLAVRQVTGTPLPPDLADWLTKLKLLYGIPFNYLVPDEQMLPMESLRFFQVDDDWINALTDGALSIGRHFNGEVAPPATAYLDVHLQAQLHAEPNGRLASVRRLQLNLEAAPAPMALGAPAGRSGFLLRSAVVAGWKNLDVMGYPKGKSPYDYEQGVLKDPSQITSLDILRLERLSETVLLGIFQGPLYELVLHEPPEAIHFGFGQLAPNLTKTLRVPTTNWDDPNTSYDTNKYQNQRIPGQPFANRAARVLDMQQLSQQLGAMLHDIDPPAAPGYYQATPANANYQNHLVSSDFALEMVQGAGLVSFINAHLTA